MAAGAAAIAFVGPAFGLAPAATAQQPHARAALSRTAPAPAVPRAPAASDTPALLSGNGTLLSTPATGPGGDPAATTTSSGDPLAQNGFGSVLCRDHYLQQGLSTVALSNCRTSTFVAAAAPTGNYGFDVHIDTGLLPGSSTLAMLVQDLLLTPVWTALVWITHALIVALEWCYSLDLLNAATMGGVAGALRSAQATVTQPWLAAVLAVASVLALYHGVIRRRVVDTLGEFLLMVAMMGAGLWVIVDPVGTVGSLGHWANSASLGTVSAVTSGSPSRPEGSFGDGMRSVFATAIGGPWCFLEFGNVDWCREPARLDPSLRKAAAQIAQAKRASGTPAARDSAALLAAAQSNGDLFLALPANGPERNSINDSGSLLHVLCQSTDANNCRGPTAAQAEFRTAGATWSRAGGLLLIVLGFAGMVCVLAFIALRLLGAALASLLYLLMAPVAVLAPALGDGGRAAFRAWAGRLLAALMAKLIYSVLLGVVLLMLRLLQGLSGFGWWTQWLLVACLWWTAFAHRHQVLGLMTGQQGERRGRSALPGALTYGRDLGRIATRIRAGRPTDRRPPPSRAQPTLPDPTVASSPTLGGSSGSGSAPGSSVTSGRVAQTPTPGSEPRTELPVSASRLLAEQLDGVMASVRRDPGASKERHQRLEQQMGAARAAGDDRRAQQLKLRAQRVAQQLDAHEDTIDVPPSKLGDPSARAERRAWLDHQASLPNGRTRVADPAQRRDYAGLAGLAGLTPARYRAARGGEQLRARLAIDRELDRRRQVLSDQQTVPAPVARPTDARASRPRSAGPGRLGGAPPPSAPTIGAARQSPQESIVMRRERQLLRERGVAPPAPAPVSRRARRTGRPSDSGA